MKTGALWQRFWLNRATLGQETQQRELVQFLPPVLEIQETPPSPMARRLGWALITLFSLGLLWALLGKIDVVATAEGKIIPSSRTKQIQPLQKAVVKKILVHNGERVIRGQPLVELDATLTQAEEQRIQNQLLNARALLEVSQAFLDGLESPEDGAQPAPALLADPLYQKLLVEQQRDYRAQMAALTSNLDKTQAEQQVARETLLKLEQTVPIVTRRSETLGELQRKGFASEFNYLELEQERIRHTRDLAGQRHALTALQADEREIRQRIQALAAQQRALHLNRTVELQEEIAVLQEELIKARDLNARQTLYAPVDGRVQQLAIHTEGGVVTEAQQLMLVVPEEETLEVEARLLNKDIGFVRQGMPAEVKIHTFPFTQYGVIQAQVASIDQDATQLEDQDLIYNIRLKMARDTLDVNGTQVNLLPGMAVTAEVKTDRRKIIDYFIRPVRQHLQESLRER